MKPFRYTLIIAMLILNILAPVKTPSKPIECSPPFIVDLSQPISECIETVGEATTSFGWGVYWADGTSEDPAPSESAGGTCDAAWQCVPDYQDAEVQHVNCPPRIIEAFGTTIQEENLAFFVYQVASNGTTVNFYACGNCYHGFADDPNGKSVLCQLFPHQEHRLPGPCN